MGQEQLLAEKKANGWSPEAATLVGTQISDLLESFLGECMVVVVNWGGSPIMVVNNGSSSSIQCDSWGSSRAITVVGVQ